MKHLITCCLLAILSSSVVYSQELNAKVTINSDKVQGIDKNVFTTLQNSLLQLLNERQWTDATFGKNERIDCSFIFTINTATENNNYTAELQISSRRPVYNSAYSTPMFNYKDVDLSFEYTEGESLEFNETNITNNLLAVTVFYTYVILGLDFDSFALNGGRPYFERAMNIVNAAQTLNTKGWTPFENDRNRYALGLVLTEESSARFHEMWYNYHRLGLDEMAGNLNRGRTNIIATIPVLQELYSSRPSSAILLFYGDTKLQEVVDVCTEATSEEKKEAYDLLRKIYPTRSSQLEVLKK